MSTKEEDGFKLTIEEEEARVYNWDLLQDGASQNGRSEKLCDVSSTAMKARLRVPLSILALLAMFATLMPGTLWACPITGRIDAASRVCTMPVMSGEMPCAHMGGKCCKPVSSPPQTDDGLGRPHIFTAPSHAFLSFAFVASSVEAAPFVVPGVEAFEALAIRSFLARFANSPPLFWTSHRPTLVAGRAPPVV